VQSTIRLADGSETGRGPIDDDIADHVAALVAAGAAAGAREPADGSTRRDPPARLRRDQKRSSGARTV
jgi:hypothetical protein